ncbi:MAG: DMT family transporter, partial [Alphaproteobacteria bacterium]
MLSFPAVDRWIAAAQVRAHRAPAATRGAAWMVFAAALMAILATLIRNLSFTLHPFEIAFFRSFLGLVFIAPWLLRSGLPAVRTERFGLFTVRAVVGALAMLTWFQALALLPLADAVALSFTSPLFATAGAALFLGETVRARRWTATAIGFLGAMVILRPGSGTLTLAATLVLVSAATMAAAGLMVKELSRTEPPTAIVLYMVLLMSPLTLVPALFVWSWPTASQMLWLVFLAAVATMGNFAMTRALVVADISVVASFDFVRLPFAALLGFLVFGEVPDHWTWLGAAVIASSTVYIVHREAVLERRRRRAAQP